MINSKKNRLLYYNFNSLNTNDIKIMKRVDEKIDDGVYNGGLIRTCCIYGSCNKDYVYAIDNKDRCIGLSVNMEI